MRPSRAITLLLSALACRWPRPFTTFRQPDDHPGHAAFDRSRHPDRDQHLRQPARSLLPHLEPLGDPVFEGGSLGGFTLEPGFNDIIRMVATATQVDVADTFGKLTVDDWVGGDDCLHPDISGHKRMAEIFRGEIAALS